MGLVMQLLSWRMMKASKLLLQLPWQLTMQMLLVLLQRKCLRQLRNSWPKVQKYKESIFWFWRCTCAFCSDWRRLLKWTVDNQPSSEFSVLLLVPQKLLFVDFATWPRPAVSWNSRCDAFAILHSISWMHSKAILSSNHYRSLHATNSSYTKWGSCAAWVGIGAMNYDTSKQI